jgi:predicted amidohydrolase YtcJ
MEGAEMLVIRAGTLIDGKRQALKHRVILVDEERIFGPGAEGELDIPPDAETIDASGQRVVPGMIDAHVHMRMSGPLDVKQPELPEVTELPATTALRSYVNAKADPGSDFLAPMLSSILPTRRGELCVTRSRCGLTISRSTPR